MKPAFLKLAIIMFLFVWNASCVFRLAHEDGATVKNLEGYSDLGKFAFKEAWYGIYFQEDKVGYSHFLIEPSGKNFLINSDSVMKLTALKKTNEINMKEKVLVRPDLTLISFESFVDMNDKRLEVTGKNDGAKLVVGLTASGEKIDQTYQVEGSLYHSSAISLMPALKGLSHNASNSFMVFNPEKQSMELVEQLITQVSGSPGPNEAVWKVQNKLGSTVVNSWLNPKGLTVLEKALDGSLITVLEDESLAKEFLSKKASQKDLILDLSLVKSPKSISNPSRTKYLSATMSGVDPSLFPDDHRQKLTPASEDPSKKSFRLVVNVEKMAAPNRHGEAQPAEGSAQKEAPNLEKELASTFIIQSEHHKIVQLADSIVHSGDGDIDRVIKLVNWTSDNIRKSMRDSFSALEVLQTMEGECQSHASLYTALARALKIPTRIVTGLVYSEGLGFLYHAWAESYVGSWLSVDPTLKQTPADATHIKIGTASDGVASDSLLKMVGKLKIESIDYH